MSKPKNLTVPRELFASMVKAIRLAARDSRKQDRVLHDESRDALTVADDGVRDFVDGRSGIG